MHETPSLPAYSDFPESYELSSPNLFAAAGADHRFQDLPLTLGLIVGVEMPATITTPTGLVPGDMFSGDGESVTVVRGSSVAAQNNRASITTLPPGENAMPQYAAKGTVRVDVFDSFATIVDAYYVYDPNQLRNGTRESTEGMSGLQPAEFGQFKQLGFNITLQARF